MRHAAVLAAEGQVILANAEPAAMLHAPVDTLIAQKVVRLIDVDVASK